MPHPESDATTTLPPVSWQLAIGEAAGFDGAGVHALAEVTGPGFTADGHVHMLDDPGLVAPPALDDLRRVAGFHEWVGIRGLIAVRAAEVEGDRVVLISEVFGGQPLSRVVGAVPVPPRAAAELVAELAETLHLLHAAAPPGAIRPAGLAHGGVDLDHVMVGKKGEVALLEAGLAPALRRRGVAASDPGFMAPEVRETPDGSPASDVYGASMVLLSCLTGRPPDPFPADPEAHAEAVESVLAGVFELDPGLEDLLRRGLGAEASVRPSARELAARLREQLPKLGGRWFSAWAGDALAAHRTYAQIPRGVEAPEPPTETSQRDAAPAPIGGLRPLQKVAVERRPLDTRRLLIALAGAAGTFGLLLLAGLFASDPVVRWWVDIHGPMETEDVPTDLPGPPRTAEGDASPRTAVVPDAGRSARAGVAGGVAAADSTPATAGFALATPDNDPSRVGTPAVRLETAPPPPPPVPQEVLPMPIEAEEAFGQDWEEVGSDMPRLKLEVIAPLADDLRVVCANGVSAHGVDQVSLTARQGRCDVRVVGVSGLATGRFRPENPGRVTCRVEFADQLRCRGE